MVMLPDKKKRRINPLLAERAIHLSFNQTTKLHSNPDTFQGSVRTAASQNSNMDHSLLLVNYGCIILHEWKSIASYFVLMITEHVIDVGHFNFAQIKRAN